MDSFELVQLGQRVLLRADLMVTTGSGDADVLQLLQKGPHLLGGGRRPGAVLHQGHCAVAQAQGLHVVKQIEHGGIHASYT